MANCDPEVLAQLTDAELASLRAAMRAVGYEGEAVAEFEKIAPRMPDAVRLPAVNHMLRRRGDGLGTLASVFTYLGRVGVEALATALGSATFAALERVGAVTREGDEVYSDLRLIPFRGLWIASDNFGGDDPVMGPGMTTDELIRVVSWAGAASMIDIGCGAGQIPLIARAAGVRQAVGVDIDPRAISFGRFNSRLNEIECEWHLGDLLAPVAGRKFDIITSQPAYVAKPAALDSVTFLHGGARGDELAHRVIAALSDALSPTGRAWVLFDAPEPEPPVLVGAIRRSLGPAPRDVCVLVSPAYAASDQAIGYAALRRASLGSEYAVDFAAYREHFDSLGITKIRHVLLYVRPPRGRGVGVVLERPSLMRSTSAGLDGLLDAAIAANLPPPELLALTVRPPRGAKLVHEQSLARPDRARLRVTFEGDAAPERAVSDSAAILLCTLRDHRPLHAAVAAFADASGQAPDEALAEVLAFVREGLRSGLLLVE